jgi:hypothetical protein
VSPTRVETLEQLDRSGRLVEQRVRPDRTFDGWNGREVLCHLAEYARVVGAIVRGTAEERQPTTTELYGRELTAAQLAMTDLDEINAAVQREYASLSYTEALAFWRAMHAEVVTQVARLTDDQLAAPGQFTPTSWARPHLADQVTALTAHYAAHMAADS